MGTGRVAETGAALFSKKGSVSICVCVCVENVAKVGDTREESGYELVSSYTYIYNIKGTLTSISLSSAATK